MTALAVSPEPAHDDATTLVAVDTRSAVPGEIPTEIAEAEARWWRGLLIGIAIGVPVCALLWMGLVALALAVASPGWPVWPALGMAAVVGVFAGMFLGGWAGVTARAEALDEAELHRPRGH
jgi:hypothetical protein